MIPSGSTGSFEPLGRRPTPSKRGWDKPSRKPKCSTRLPVAGSSRYVRFHWEPSAGVRNRARNCLEFMPHPEHAADPRTGSTAGLSVFRSLERFAA